MGGTLDRIAVSRLAGNTIECVSTRPGPAALAGSCDGCPGKHSPITIRCSMNNGAARWHTDGVLYDFVTRQEMTGWRLLDARQPRGGRGTQWWAPPRGDKTHRALITQAAADQNKG